MGDLESGSTDGPEPVDGTASGPRSLTGDASQVIALASMLGLVGLVAFVGAVGVFADVMNTWTWFFRLERLAAMSAPLAVLLLAVSIAGWLGVVYESS